MAQRRASTFSRYETARASTLVDRITHIVAETEQTGSHFVGEAAPPKALKARAQELLGQGMKKAIYNFMQDMDVENDAHQWFELPKAQCSKTNLPCQKIAQSIGHH